jgi:excisionase family DNA binding protein
MLKSKTNYITSTEAADILGFSRDYVRKLIIEGRLKAEKLGRNWIIEKKYLKKIHRKRAARIKEHLEDGSDK